VALRRYGPARISHIIIHIDECVDRRAADPDRPEASQTRLFPVVFAAEGSPCPASPTDHPPVSTKRFTGS
jgi:hypothetical protein